jgi:hypothetical protein
MKQYKCSNCKHRKRMGNLTTGYCIISGRKEYGTLLTDVIAEIGCASHSDFRSEREKTIDEFYQRLKVERDPIFDGVSWDDIDRIFVELREGKV